MAIGLACLAAGCSRHDDPSPFAESRTPAGLAERFYPPEGWAWGFVKIADAPAQRYGVGAAPGVAAARILVLTDYGESAEDWFETIRDLNRRGFTVWLLEGVGQGGSGRLTGTRDLGHVEDFDTDAEAARAMIETVIRPSPPRPLILLGEGVGAALAIRVATESREVAGVILSQPAVDAGPPPAADPFKTLRWLGLGRRRAIDRLAWPAGAKGAGRWADPWREAARGKWRRLNPDLRIGGPSVDWLTAESENLRLAHDLSPTLGVPVLVTATTLKVRCEGAARCRAVGFAGHGVSPTMAPDGVRGAWLREVAAFTRARIAETRAR